jgi:hypothetical protein
MNIVRTRLNIVYPRNSGAVTGIIGTRLARVPVIILSAHDRDAADPHGTNHRRNPMLNPAVSLYRRHIARFP